MKERRKALIRDAKDESNKLTTEARKFIKDNNGKRVPKGYEVSHIKPLYTKKTIAGKKALDIAENMETIPKKEHRASHKRCGTTYHDYPM